MNHSKIDNAIKVVMAGLLCLLAVVIFRSMREHVTGIGDMAPEFSITTDQGKTITPKNFGGKTLILNFWASWCQPCVDEAPSLAQLQQNLASSGVVVLGVSIDKNPKLYANFIKRFHLDIQTMRDPESEIPASFGTYKIPETYIIDKTGKVVQKFIGSPPAPNFWADPELVGFIKSI
jgi:peroxiredoxin